jgi:hypothetical protein
MADANEAYPFQVAVWVPGTRTQGALFEWGHWMEMARCASSMRASEVAECLAPRYPKGVQVAELIREQNGGMRFVGSIYLPPEARYYQMKEDEWHR